MAQVCPDVRYQIDEFAYLHGVDLLERLGIRFEKADGQTQVNRGRIHRAGSTYRAKFQTWDGKYEFICTMSGSDQSAALDTLKAIENAFGEHLMPG